MFQKIICAYQKNIDKKLEIFFNQEIKKASLISKQTKQTLKILKNYNLKGGKKLRPILINCGYFLAEGRNKKAILNASISIELIHNFLLIHDDIIDRDNLRRGAPSLHYFYQKKYKDSHLGNCLAMVAGDINSCLGYQMLINSNFPVKNKLKAIGILNEIIKKTCYGEILEMYLKWKSIKEKDILKVYKYKTAYYTFIGPLQIGAGLAGADDKFLQGLEKFALPLGIAFQIQDDILGLFGTKKIIGKPVGSDIRENQPNLLIFKTLKLVKSQERIELKKYLGRKDIDRNDIIKIRNIIKKSGALEYCQNKAKNLINEAKYFLEKIKSNSKQKQFLVDFADYIIKRNY